MKLLTAKFDESLSFDRLFFFTEIFDKHLKNNLIIDCDFNEYEEICTATGDSHVVMKFIGFLADNGEDCLVEVR